MTTLANTSTHDQIDFSAVDKAEPNRPEPKADDKPEPKGADQPTTLAEAMANIGKDELRKLLAMSGRAEVGYDQSKGDFVITDYEGLQRVANLYVSAGMCKKLIEYGETLKHDQHVMRATAVMQAGSQLGLSTFASVRYMAWIRGNPCPWGDAIPSIVYRAKNPDGTPCVLEFDESTEQYEHTDAKSGAKSKRWKARCTIVRLMPSGGKRTVTHEFSYSDAVAADLHGSPTWKTYEKRMVQCRARTLAARDAVPDAMCGMVCAEEEMDTAYLEEKRAKEGRASSVSAKIDALPEK